MKPPIPVFTHKDIEENKLMACLSYLSILIIIPLLLRKESPFLETHVRQGIVLLTFFVLASIISVPVFSKLVLALLLIADILALIDAFRGKFFPIPGIYALSQKFKI